jgi:putative peptide zinc metalloprotease protein
MAKTLFSTNWYRVASLRPRLRSHAQIHRQVFRKQIWYVLQDHVNGRFHRLTPAAYHVVTLMNGRRTVQDIWEIVVEKLEGDLPTQDEVVRLLGQLHNTDLISGDIPPDLEELAYRSGVQKRRSLIMKIRNPMALRFPLIDPDRFLELSLPLVRPIFTKLGFLLWTALVVYGVVLMATNWTALTADFIDKALAAQNLLLVLIAYPMIKALHELGHGYATKVWGGEVHEMGIMLLVFLPVPYVDASASSAFASKWRRAIVGGAGIMVEMALAVLALIVWLNTEAGIVRAFAYNVMLVAGASTVLFNGNPLLRFDGYYVFGDVIEIPNLGTRANRYFLYLIKRYLFGVPDLTSPATSEGERAWMFLYSIASFVYRFFIILGIALFVATKLFFVGILLAVWAVFQSLILPFLRGIQYLVQSRELLHRRRRAIALTAAATCAVLVVLLGIPVPYATITQGVMWIPERSIVRTGTDGTVVAILARPNSIVRKGQVLLRLDDPSLEAKLRVIRSDLRISRLRFAASQINDKVQTKILREQIHHLEAAERQIFQQTEDLIVRSPIDGTFVVPQGADLQGRFLEKGDLVAYVVDHRGPVVRVVVTPRDVDLVRSRVRGVVVRFADHLDRKVRAHIRREVPSARDELPSKVLGVPYGGPVSISPRDPDQRRALEHVFQFDLALDTDVSTRMLGIRAYVRFDHGSEPIVWRIFRSIRQLFLGAFNV